MKKMGLNQIREEFLSFFESKGHLRQESFPLVPQGDAGLLLINSGMAPLKPYFSGEVTPPSKRMTTCQKCVRTPDIERVGKTSRHGTFFEMLGNFSFGDYFKREAAAWAWEFCINVMELPEDRLYVSVYLDDDEAWDIWTKEVGVAESHMTRLGKADNFWEIGAGPCGPCSEIYFDRGEENGCGSPDCRVGCDCDRYVEFWNLVFTQFNNDGAGNYTPLKQKNIDTGMGLERLACISQGVDNLFEVDTVRRIREHVSEIAGVAYGEDDRRDASLRIVTDHIRSTTMLVCDGVLPSNEGRGYVLRRLLRRAARHGRLLGVTEPFLYKVCETVISESGGAYPELAEKKAHIVRVITQEEERFAQTIDAGMRMLGEALENVRGVLMGETAFKLYDTYGFPVDLTAEILEEAGVGLDREGFDRLMELQKRRAREARKAMGDLGWTALELGLDRDIKTEFVGYNETVCAAKILSVLVDGQVTGSMEEGQEGVIVLDRTPFYAESGGQTADCGVISSDMGSFAVSDVQKSKDGKYLHIGRAESGALSKGDSVESAIDGARRAAIMRAHTATHLLQKALRNVLGEHVTQAGSYVEPDRLRLDFTHYVALTPEEIERVNTEVNEAILRGLPVTASEMPLDEAKAIGAMALFSEKYGSTVRVVRAGDYSIELCGGTHLDNTAKTGSLFFRSESSVAAGVRRIEAWVGMGVVELMNSNARVMQEASGLLNTSPGELLQNLKNTLGELKNLNRTLSKFKQARSNDIAEHMLVSAKQVAGLNVVTGVRNDVDAEQLRAMGDFMRDRNPCIVAVMASVADEKITFFAVCGANAVSRGIKAGDIIRMVSKACGGSGGGKPESAMGGGRDVLKLDDALAMLDDYVSENAKEA